MKFLFILEHIPVCGKIFGILVFLCLSGAPTFRLLRRHLLFHTIVCKICMLKFSIASEFFNCSLFTVLKTQWNLRRLDWTRLGRCEHPVTLESDWTGLDSTRICWCVHTLNVMVSVPSTPLVNSFQKRTR